MDTLLRFGSGSTLYTFDPDDQVQLKDNFRDVVPRTTRLPGLSGGFDEYGVSPAPSEIGNVQMTFWMLATSAADMLARKEAVGRMISFGKRRLYKQSVYPTDGERYCEARVNSIQYNERSSERPDKYLQVTVNFQVDNPHWYKIGTEAPSYNDGSTYNSGVIYGGAPNIQTLTGLDNSFSVTPDGNSITHPRFLISIPATKAATNMRIQRMVNGAVVDEIRFAGTLVAGDLFEVNCRAYSVFKNGADGYTNDFTFATAGWFRLLGGQANTIRVLMANAADQITLYTRYYDAFNV